MTCKTGNLKNDSCPDVQPKHDRDWIQNYLANQACWDRLVDRKIPGASLIKWGVSKRVFLRGDRVIKAKISPAAGTLNQIGELQNEFEINKMCEGRLWTLHPTYKVCDGQWELMRLDHLPGETLSVLIEGGHEFKIGIFALTKNLIHLSWLGVAYKQLRGRHIYQDDNGCPIFIDFGDSWRTTRWSAFCYNLLPFRRTNGRWQLSNFGYLAGTIIRQRFFKNRGEVQEIEHVKNRPHESLSAAVIANQHRKNCDDLAGPVESGSLATNSLFREWKRSVCDWFEECPDRGCDQFRWEFREGAIVWGGESWGVVWGGIRRELSFKDKDVVEFGCSMGLGSVHARLEGARSVHSFTDDPGDVPVGMRAVNFFGVDQVQVSVIGKDEIPPKISRNSIGLALSIRANENNWDRVRAALASCSVIVKRTRDGIEYLES